MGASDQGRYSTPGLLIANAASHLGKAQSRPCMTILTGFVSGSSGRYRHVDSGKSTGSGSAFGGGRSLETPHNIVVPTTIEWLAAGSFVVAVMSVAWVLSRRSSAAEPWGGW